VVFSGAILVLREEKMVSRRSNNGGSADLERARWKFSVLEPLLGRRGRTREDVANRAKQFGISTNTLYSWLAKAEISPNVSSQFRAERSDHGQERLHSDVEKAISEALQKEFSETHGALAKVVAEVARKCTDKKLVPPHYHTVRKRFNQYRKKQIASRVTQTRAESNETERFSVNHSLDAVEIGFGPVHLFLTGLKGPGLSSSPWVSFAMDHFSKSVLGFWISGERPGEFELGQCVANAILPKERILAKHGITQEWPCAGIPATLIVPASELSSRALNAGCSRYGIKLHSFRELKHRPCLTSLLNTLEAAYDPELSASLEFERFERRILQMVLSHNSRVDVQTGLSPVNLFRNGLPRTPVSAVFSDKSASIIGERIRLDFMPLVERTIQGYGVLIHGVRFSGPGTRKWMRNRDSAQKFLLRLDPRDLYKIWLLDPELDKYFELTSCYPSSKGMTWKALERFKQLGPDPGETTTTRKVLDRNFAALDRAFAESLCK
jgi:putative transposase